MFKKLEDRITVSSSILVYPKQISESALPILGTITNSHVITRFPEQGSVSELEKTYRDEQGEPIYSISEINYYVV